MPRPRKQSARRRQNTTVDQVIGDQVRTLRREISQQELADRLGWTQSTVARIESGKRAVSVSDLLALSWALDVAPVYLLAGSFQDDDVPVVKTLRVPPEHMLSWIRGVEPLPNAGPRGHRAYFTNMPDLEWLDRFSSAGIGGRELLAIGAEQRDRALMVDDPTPNPLLSAEQQEAAKRERAARRRQAEAARKARG